MSWIVVRTYGNGKYMNSVYPVQFEYLSKAQEQADKLNKKEHLSSFSDKWIAIPIFKEEQP